ncbi:MAG TPA: glycosyltransferase, partial [Cyclobacteriaceae bacterium]|nr:glycosyltransferase [Cyclobacteriaceae bacterium]
VLRITMEGVFKQRQIEKVYYSLSGPKKSALIKDTLIGIPLKLFFKKKLILQVHAGGYNESFIENKFLFKLLRMLYRNIEHLLCLTEYQKKELEFLRAKTHDIVYNFCEDVAGTEIDLHSNKSDDKSFLRLLCVGHLNPNKGIAECITLASILKSKNINFHWRLVGAFQDHMFECRIRAMISEFNLENHITIENEIANDLIFAEYNKADFLIFLSNGPEGQPVVLIEALMIAKAIIIAKDISGINEYVTNGYNGFLCQNYNEILPLLTNYKSIDTDKIRVQARKTYLDFFSVDVFSQRIGKVFGSSFVEKN